MNTPTDPRQGDIHDLADALNDFALLILDWAGQIGRWQTKNATLLTYAQGQQMERAYTGLSAAASRLAGISAVNRLQVIQPALDHIKAVTTQMGDVTARLAKVNSAISIATAAIAFAASLSTGDIAAIAAAASAVTTAAKGAAKPAKKQGNQD